MPVSVSLTQCCFANWLRIGLIRLVETIYRYFAEIGPANPGNDSHQTI